MPDVGSGTYEEPIFEATSGCRFVDKVMLKDHTVITYQQWLMMGKPT
jgi:hypothetical protein